MARQTFVEKMRLHGVNGGAYTFAVAETTVTGRENPWTIGGRAAAHAAIFSSARFCTPVFYGGPGKGQLRLGRFPMGRFLTPCRQARHPSCENERRASNSTIGGRYMRHAAARPEQTQSPLEIIRIALRNAALSDRPNDAIDVLGAALLQLAVIARAEVRHA
ncbi:hypothetical protein [Burkholderia pseudomallei]|uniref:hypothetical protein n=2 Tax=Burkholderia TaxID=32008 RepID=UPI001178A31A|nr:hypothetical protein [Burkholderia pseudomallei]